MARARPPPAGRAQPLRPVRLVVVLVYCYVFASIENFGIIARQRSLVLPFLFVALAAIASHRTGDRSGPDPVLSDVPARLRR